MISTQETKSAKQTLQTLHPPPPILLGKGTETLAYLVSKIGNSKQHASSMYFPREGKILT